MPRKSMTIASRMITVVCLSVAAGAAQAETIAIKAGRIDTAAGKTIEHGVILIEDGVIKAVGTDVAIPDGATVIDHSTGVVTPGLIDANAQISNERNDVEMPPGDSFVREGRHKHLHWNFPLNAVMPLAGCCGSNCPAVLSHTTGEPCPYCGFPNAVPSLAAPEPTALGVTSWQSVSEQSSEVVPNTRVIDSINLASKDFDRLARRGVTTVFASPDSAAVIGARGAILKTADPAAQRTISNANAIKAAMGSDPSFRGGRNQLPFGDYVNLHSRRPTTRMGVTWVFRKALYEAKARAAGNAQIGGADTPPDEALDALVELLKGNIPLRIQARKQIDIITALRLTEEFNLDFILEEGLEAYRCVNQLKERNVPVIYGPILVDPVGFRAALGEADNTRLTTPQDLIDGGLRMALTANDLRDEEGLAAQAMYAMRYGLSYDDALAAVTSVPAQILGIADSVGTIEPGKSADLVLWGGPPFAATTPISKVLIAGAVVHQMR